MITTAAREGKKKISPYMPQEGAAGMMYHGLVVVMVSLTVNYLVIPFQVCTVLRGHVDVMYTDLLGGTADLDR